MKKRGVLFDLDGVLIDSEPIYSRFYDGIAEIYPTGEEHFSQVIKGSTIEKILDRYFPQPEVRNDVLRRINEFEATMEYPIFDGVIEFLEDLRRHSMPTAIVTSSSDNKMERLWARHPQLKDYFGTIVTGSHVTHSKPHPQCYLIAAERLGCDPADCYVIEDSLSGMASGMAAGCTVIGLTTTLPRTTINGKAHLIADNLAGFTVDMLP